MVTAETASPWHSRAVNWGTYGKKPWCAASHRNALIHKHSLVPDLHTMAPATLALLFLLSPTIAFADTLHFPLNRRSQPLSTPSARNAEAHRLRIKYGYEHLTSSRSNRRAGFADVPVIDQVFRHCYFPCFISTHHINRMEMPATLLLCPLVHRKLIISLTLSTPVCLSLCLIAWRRMAFRPFSGPFLPCIF